MKFLDSLNKTKIDLTNLVFIPQGGGMEIHQPFEISPITFLKFAKNDLHNENEQGVINAISNAKRAIDCQIDVILSNMGIDHQKLPKTLDQFINCFEFEDEISYKLKIIQGINLAPGFIIAKYRTLRNKLEHYYKIPTIEEVKEAIDIAELFIRSIDGHNRSILNESSLTDKNNYLGNFKFTNGYDIDYNTTAITFHEIINEKRTHTYIFTIKDPEFFGFLRFVNSFGDDFELAESFKIIANLIKHPIPLQHINVTEY